MEGFDLSATDKNHFELIAMSLQHYLWEGIKSILPPETSSHKVQHKLDAVLSDGHRCLRGERNASLRQEIELAISSIAYDLSVDGVYKKHFVRDVPADGNSAFQVLGINRVSSIKDLREPIFGGFNFARLFNNVDPRRMSLIEILLKDLETQDGVSYPRKNVKDNLARITRYLNTLLIDKTQITYNQRGCCVLDALAYLQKKNLRIFEADPQGELHCVTQHINSDAFETIDILATSADGHTDDRDQINHFARLIYLPQAAEELVHQNNAGPAP